MKIAVLGCGGWGLAVTVLLHANGHQVTAWGRDSERFRTLCRTRTSEKLLPGILLSEEIGLTSDLSCVQDCPVVVLAVPSFAVADLAGALKSRLKPGQVLVLLSKGFDRTRGYCLLSETLEQLLPDNPVVALTGPSHAEEVARNIPTAVLAASRDEKAAELVQSVFMRDSFRVYTSPDIVSAELGGAMKNIMALAVGISDGAGLGDNTKAMIMTRGIAEMARLGRYLGGRTETFSGLSGVGDLIVTCISNHSRNRRCGLLIGQGLPVERAMEQVGAVVEGYYATQAIHELTRDAGLDMPISAAMYRLLFLGEPLREVVRDLMERDRRAEPEFWK
jgi:glycerol-3-phosphate dehydrogenase (NAD(P)+)